MNLIRCNKMYSLQKLPLTGFEKTRHFLGRPKKFAPMSAILVMDPGCENRLTQAFLNRFAHAFAIFHFVAKLLSGARRGFLGFVGGRPSNGYQAGRPRHLGAFGGRNRQTTPTPKPSSRGVKGIWQPIAHL